MSRMRRLIFVARSERLSCDLQPPTLNILRRRLLVNQVMGKRVCYSIRHRVTRYGLSVLMLTLRVSDSATYPYNMVAMAGLISCQPRMGVKV